MPKFAANLTFLFTELEPLARIRAAADAGFRAVEIQDPYSLPIGDLRDALTEAGVEMVLINTPQESPDKGNSNKENPGKGEKGLAALPGREGEFREGLFRALETASALGCSRLHIMAGIAPEGVSVELCRETYVNNLRFAVDACAGTGICPLIEAINPYDLPGYFLNRMDDARGIVDVVGPGLRLQFDFYHAQIMGGNLAETFKACFEIIGHIQIAGVPGRFEPDMGEINYPFLFSLIDDTGYDGWVGCEYRPRNGTLAGLGWARGWGVNGNETA